MQAISQCHGQVEQMVKWIVIKLPFDRKPKKQQACVLLVGKLFLLKYLSHNRIDLTYDRPNLQRLRSKPNRHNNSFIRTLNSPMDKNTKHFARCRN